MVQRTEILLDGFGVTESLRWREGALWFSDLAAGSVHRWTPPDRSLRRDERASTGPETVVDIPGRAGGLGWLPDGRLLAVSMDERAVYRLEHDGSLVRHADISEHAGGHANDMLVDETGRAFVGNFGFDYHEAHRTQANSAMYAPPGPPSTTVVCLDPSGEVIGTSPQLLFPNGMVQLPGGSVVVAETLRMRLTELDVDERGVLVRPRPWADTIPPRLWRMLTSGRPLGRVARAVSSALDKPAIAKRSSSPMAPDGICLHHDGETIWMANALRNEVARVARGGKVVQRVRTSQQALDCVLGGPEGRTLFVATTLSDDPTVGGPARQGRIEVIEL